MDWYLGYKVIRSVFVSLFFLFNWPWIALYSYCSIVLILVHNYCVSFLEKNYPNIYPIISKRYIDSLVVEKKDLFKILKTSADEQPISNGKSLKILELGVGPGNNFAYYPNNSRLIIVEPNKYFSETRNQNLSQFPGLTVEKEILNDGKYLYAIEDSSVDVVVATFVLCSVGDINAVLKEIHRVLVPGGWYLFMEHGYGSRKCWQWILQRAVNPLWKIVNGGCQLTKNTVTNIQDCNLFVNMEFHWFHPPREAPARARCLLGMGFYGTAQKASQK